MHRAVSARRELALTSADERLEGTLGRALDRLVALLDSPEPALQLRAAVAILDRVLGRPSQRLEHAGELQLSSGEGDAARARLTELLTRRAHNSDDS